jgi:hypothetical protein
MKALEVFAIYVTPFLVLGLLIKLLMKRYTVDLTDVQEQVRPKRRPRKAFLLSAWRAED